MGIRTTNNLSLSKFLGNPLLMNSFYLMFASVLSSFFGFIFWIIVAKKYQPEDVGVATALISSMMLLILFSRFGFDYSIIRFFPKSESKDQIYSASLIFTTLCTIFLGVVLVEFVNILAPELKIIKLGFNPYAYLLSLVANSIATLAGYVFIANRKGNVYFLQTMLIGSRILFVVPLVSFGSIGIFGSVGISFALAAITSIIYISASGVNFTLNINKDLIKPIMHFSLINYIANLFISGPNQIIPLLILHTIGKEETAYYYISYAIASLIFMIPNAVSMSLFVEGSNGEALKKTTIKSICIICLLLIPSLLIIWLKGDILLSLIGNEYSNNGFELLKLMSISSIFMSIVNIFCSIIRLQTNINSIMYLNGIIGVLIVGLSFLFMLKFGLVGVGYAWILSYIIGAVIVGIFVFKKGYLNILVRI